MSKQQLIQQFVDDNIGQEYRTVAIAEVVGCTLPTVLSFIKNNPDRFEKISHGKYLIKSQTFSVSVSDSSLDSLDSTESDITDNNFNNKEISSSSEVNLISTYHSNISLPKFDW